MKTRIITGAVFGSIFLGCVVAGFIPFLLFCLVAMGIGVFEYTHMAHQKESFFMRLMAIAYISASFAAFITLGMFNGPLMIFYLLILIWSTDSFAYFIGRKIGKTKLAPVVSPNKTWEGSIGGTLAATVLSLAYFLIFQPFELNIIWFVVTTIILSVVGQLGDLVESYFKRKYGVKDSGNLLPGHGGILDRFDSLMLVSLVGVFLL